MYTLYRLNSDDLDEAFVQSLRALFKGKTIEIAVSEAEDGGDDETAYLLREPANRRRLMEAIENVDAGKTQDVELFGQQ